MNRIDLRALILAGPLQHKPVPDPLAVQLLENRLYMTPDSHMKHSYLLLELFDWIGQKKNYYLN